MKLIVFIIAFVVFNAGSVYAQHDDYMKKIGESATVCYVMYADNYGNLYFVNIEDHFLDLMKYDSQTDTVSKISDDFTDDDFYSGRAYCDGFGAIAPTTDGDTVYGITTGHNSSAHSIFKLNCLDDSLEYVTGVCGKNYWKIKNLTLSQDNKSLYYVANNTSSDKSIRRIDLETLACTNELDLDSLIPHRNLCYSGINVWDKDNSFYVPVWSFNYDDSDLAVLKVRVDTDDISARLLHFTDDLTEAGTALFPGFRNHSSWTGIGASSKGNIYIAASNHFQSVDGTGEHGNVAVYKYDPANDEMSFLGDVKSISESVNNWLYGESQHKVHTFIMEHADGKMYFATDDYYPSHFIRGAHVYTIDIETDEIKDFSKTQYYVMQQDFSVIENTAAPSVTSGVFAEYFGIKGMALNPHVQDLMYFMTFSNPGGVTDPGHIIKYFSLSDTDWDSIPDGVDNCPHNCNFDQLDADGDGLGDVCDGTPGCGGCGQPACEQSCAVDTDSDGILDDADNCPLNCNVNQLDADTDGIGDVCDGTPECDGCGQDPCEQEC